MPQRVVVADAFTSEPFAGNPAAVCVLQKPAPEGWMQRVARELNLSETAFVVPESARGRFGLRWFTPACEVDLCGHATLATAHVLWEEGHLPSGAEAVFHTRSGRLAAHREQDRIVLDFPAEPVAACSPPAGLAQALGAEPVWVGKGRGHWLAELASEKAVRGLAPDTAALARMGAGSLIVTARSDEPADDVVSRYFAPDYGIAEDPVTGAAHCAIGPYWAGKLGKQDLVARQASARGGTLWVGVRGDRVHLGGHAVTVLRGELLHGPPA